MSNAAGIPGRLRTVPGAGPLSLAQLALVFARRGEIGRPAPEFAAALVKDQLGAMLNARSDPCQKISAIAACSDEDCVVEVLKRVAVVLGLPAQKTN